MTTPERQEQARALVAASCSAQGLPEKITDPVALGKVAAALSPETVAVGRVYAKHLARTTGRSWVVLPGPKPQ